MLDPHSYVSVTSGREQVKQKKKKTFIKDKNKYSMINFWVRIVNIWSLIIHKEKINKT